MNGEYQTCGEQNSIDLAHMVANDMHRRGLLPENSTYKGAKTEPELMFRAATDASYDADPEKSCDILWDIIDKYQLTLEYRLIPQE